MCDSEQFGHALPLWSVLMNCCGYITPEPPGAPGQQEKLSAC